MTTRGDENYYPGETGDEYDEELDWPTSGLSPDYEEIYSDTPSFARHPEVTVQLTGQDGNGFGIVCRVKMALKRAGVPEAEQDEFFTEATSGDYDHLLQTCMKWVSVR